MTAPRTAAWLAITLVVLAATRTASAHPLDVGYLRITQTSSTASVMLDLHVDAAAALLGQRSLDAAGVAARGAALASATLERFPILAAGEPCTWSGARAELVDRSAKILAVATCPNAAARTWQLPFVRDPAMAPKFQLLYKATAGGSDRLVVIESPATVLQLGTPPAAVTPALSVLVKRGLHSVGMLALLAAFLLAGATLPRMLAVASALTVGHAITAAIAATTGLHGPALLAVLVMGLAIVGVALAAALGGPDRAWWQLALACGLVTGLVAAPGPLAAVAGTHLGIGLAQLVLVLAFAPLTGQIRAQARRSASRAGG